MGREKTLKQHCAEMIRKRWDNTTPEARREVAMKLVEARRIAREKRKEHGATNDSTSTGELE